MEKLKKNKVLREFFLRFPEKQHWKILKRLAVVSVDYISSMYEGPKEIAAALKNLTKKIKKKFASLSKGDIQEDIKEIKRELNRLTMKLEEDDSGLQKNESQLPKTKFSPSVPKVQSPKGHLTTKPPPAISGAMNPAPRPSGTFTKHKHSNSEIVFQTGESDCHQAAKMEKKRHLTPKITEVNLPTQPAKKQEKVISRHHLDDSEVRKTVFFQEKRPPQQQHFPFTASGDPRVGPLSPQISRASPQVLSPKAITQAALNNQDTSIDSLQLLCEVNHTSYVKSPKSHLTRHKKTFSTGNLGAPNKVSVSNFQNESSNVSGGISTCNTKQANTPNTSNRPANIHALPSSMIQSFLSVGSNNMIVNSSNFQQASSGQDSASITAPVLNYFDPGPRESISSSSNFVSPEFKNAKSIVSSVKPLETRKSLDRIKHSGKKLEFPTEQPSNSSQQMLMNRAGALEPNKLVIDTIKQQQQTIRRGPAFNNAQSKKKKRPPQMKAPVHHPLPEYLRNVASKIKDEVDFHKNLAKRGAQPESGLNSLLQSEPGHSNEERTAKCFFSRNKDAPSVGRVRDMRSFGNQRTNNAPQTRLEKGKEEKEDSPSFSLDEAEYEEKENKNIVNMKSSGGQRAGSFSRGSGTSRSPQRRNELKTTTAKLSSKSNFLETGASFLNSPALSERSMAPLIPRGEPSVSYIEGSRGKLHLEDPKRSFLLEPKSDSYASSSFEKLKKEASNQNDKKIPLGGQASNREVNVSSFEPSTLYRGFFEQLGLTHGLKLRDQSKWDLDNQTEMKHSDNGDESLSNSSFSMFNPNEELKSFFQREFVNSSSPTKLSFNDRDKQLSLFLKNQSFLKGPVPEEELLSSFPLTTEREND